MMLLVIIVCSTMGLEIPCVEEVYSLTPDVTETQCNARVAVLLGGLIQDPEWKIARASCKRKGAPEGAK